MESNGKQMGLFQRQTEACFKKHRVINKPNYSKFRSTTDDTQEETKRSRGLQRSTLTVCPHHLKPKHLVRCAHPLQNDSILWLQNLRRTECRRLSLQALVRSGAHTISSKSKIPSLFSLRTVTVKFTPSVEKTQTHNHCKPDWVSLCLGPEETF